MEKVAKRMRDTLGTLPSNVNHTNAVYSFINKVLPADIISLETNSWSIVDSREMALEQYQSLI